ncbi:hypothetical protein [Arthrobacter sp.]|uniref:aggregation-promoting factor C-terminal-like domain-containing protein n=1 Tax=Arthrobacter sp. TaxID=1667 RepID=UPI0026DECBEC|nr:hypothetical protein [Arthrobacter sp.]MDO5753570.1 hypothetical protein [Arthrobacter sp.]
MSASPQRGRRRAENSARPSLFAFAAAGKGTRAAGKSTVKTTAKYMAAVAVVGALVAAGAVTQSVEHTANAQSGANLLAAAGHASAPAVSAPLNVPITFAGADIGSLPSAASTSAATKAAAAKAQSSDVTPLPTTAAAPAPAPAPAPVVVDDPAGAQAYAAGELAARGWGADQMSCLTQLWNRESEWLTSAENPDGGAYGIAQSLPAEKMASVGSDWKTNYKTQITWGLGYIQERYGSPCAAWGHSNAVNWY